MVNKHLDDLCKIIQDINAKEICEHIAEDNLEKWCGIIRERMYICMVELSEDLYRVRERGAL